MSRLGVLMIEEPASAGQLGPPNNDTDRRARQRRVVADAIGQKHARGAQGRQPIAEEPAGCSAIEVGVPDATQEIV